MKITFEEEGDEGGAKDLRTFALPPRMRSEQGQNQNQPVSLLRFIGVIRPASLKQTKLSVPIHFKLSFDGF